MQNQAIIVFVAARNRLNRRQEQQDYAENFKIKQRFILCIRCSASTFHCGKKGKTAKNSALHA